MDNPDPARTDHLHLGTHLPHQAQSGQVAGQLRSRWDRAVAGSDDLRDQKERDGPRDDDLLIFTGAAARTA